MLEGYKVCLFRQAGWIVQQHQINIKWRVSNLHGPAWMIQYYVSHFDKWEEKHISSQVRSLQRECWGSTSQLHSWTSLSPSTSSSLTNKVLPLSHSVAAQALHDLGRGRITISHTCLACSDIQNDRFSLFSLYSCLSYLSGGIPSPSPLLCGPDAPSDTDILHFVTPVQLWNHHHAVLGTEFKWNIIIYQFDW